MSSLSVLLLFEHKLLPFDKLDESERIHISRNVFGTVISKSQVHLSQIPSMQGNQLDVAPDIGTCVV